MSKIHIISDNYSHEALISSPDVFTGVLRFYFPEFHGRSNGRPFAIHQVLSWTHYDAHQKMHFELNSPPEETGIQFRGDLDVTEEGVCSWEAELTNHEDSIIEKGHHTIAIDTSSAPTLSDPRGGRTIVYTDKGWCPVAKLTDVEHDPIVRIGNSYDGRTIIWKAVAVIDESKKLIVAVALDKAYAFATRHADWADGLILGCRWGDIEPGETKRLRGKLYLVKDLNALTTVYNRDFR